MDVQAWQARKNAVPENQGQLGVVLPFRRRGADNAALAAADWQTMTPEEQWESMFGTKEDR